VKPDGFVHAEAQFNPFTIRDTETAGLDVFVQIEWVVKMFFLCFCFVYSVQGKDALILIALETSNHIDRGALLYQTERHYFRLAFHLVFGVVVGEVQIAVFVKRIADTVENLISDHRRDQRLVATDDLHLVERLAVEVASRVMVEHLAGLSPTGRSSAVSNCLVAGL